MTGENILLEERYQLSENRVRQMRGESEIDAPFLFYFQKTSEFLYELYKLYEKIQQGFMDTAPIEELQNQQKILYGELEGENYESSYANPSYAVKVLGEEFGGILSFLYAEARAQIVSVYEQKKEEFVIFNELFLEIYRLFIDKASYREVKDAIYWHMSDYAELTVKERVRENLDPKLDFATKIVMESDLSDLRYLYRYGEYIGENERKLANYLNSLPQKTIEDMARTYTDGYAKGFEVKSVDLRKKSTVTLRYSVGQERIVRAAIKQFEQWGLEPIIYRYAHSSMHKNPRGKIGYISTSANKQYDFDHQADNAYYIDKAFMQRKLDILRQSYEEQKELAAGFAGPACIEVFGEVPFTPVKKAEAANLSEEQEKLFVWYTEQSSKIMNEYINQEERSFTIIAYPLPEIGENFEEIFDETVKINTLDQEKYKKIQQCMIDVLDLADVVKIRGKGENKTDLTVKMQVLLHPERETNFENCLADVNIPVGEVFTSPKLEGTNGVLHVTGVYLNELYYKDLEMTFENGIVKKYTCKNFDSEEENKRYVKENVLFHHETLPLGEFAIGTNTTAYKVATQYQIFNKMPILIAEKMGPHFAVGDTCYSYCEDIAVFNPDGKEITARDNSYTIKRKNGEEPQYFHCHMDITIPYNELASIEVVTRTGEEIAIIQDGRFVLEGTQELNIPLDEI
ncbi:MAG: aminopeptidase [Lachnospiraceae bacterium]